MPIPKFTVSLIVASALLMGGYGMFEETPEEAARRIEAERQAALPLAEASCEVLQRRGNEARESLLEGDGCGLREGVFARSC